MYVIGAAGQAQMGKDTLADRLQLKLNGTNTSSLTEEILSRGYCIDSNDAIWDKKNLDELGISWERDAFATNVKKVFCNTFGVDLDFVEKWKVIEEAPPGFEMPVRKALQFIGDGFRKIQPNIWLDLGFRSRNPKIISDVRYINEFRRVKQEGGLNILVCRPDRLNNDPNGSEAQIRPYIDWCLKVYKVYGTNKKFFVVDKEYVRQLRERHDQGDDWCPPLYMEEIDLFCVNDTTKEAFEEVVDKEVAPFVQKFNFVH
jgi:hypothetical protein